MSNEPATSRRLLAAARAERERLRRDAAKLSGQIGLCQAELTSLRGRRAVIDERIASLDEMFDLGAAAPVERRPAQDGVEILYGPQIRRAAVDVLLTRFRGEPTHYRDVYEVMVQRGQVVNGKDPLATMLSQMSRSPVTRSCGRGRYEIDFNARERLASQLARVNERIAALSEGSGDDRLGEIGRLWHEASRLKKTLDEAIAALGNRSPA